MCQQTNPIYQNSMAVRDMVLLLMNILLKFSISVSISNRFLCDRYPSKLCRRPWWLCIRLRGTPTSRNPPPQKGWACTTGPVRLRGRVRYTSTTLCGGFIVAPWALCVPPRIWGVWRLRCADACVLRGGGVGVVKGTGSNMLDAAGAWRPCSWNVVVTLDVVKKSMTTLLPFSSHCGFRPKILLPPLNFFYSVITASAAAQPLRRVLGRGGCNYHLRGVRKYLHPTA